MIEIKDLKKCFGEKVAVDISSLKINDGDFVGLLGNNGAGKTTLFRLMTDLLKADSGSVEIDGTDVSKSELWKDHAGVFIDEGFLIDFLTPEEFFYFIGNSYGLKKSDVDERLELYSHFMGGEIIGTGKFIRSLSMGNKQKVGIVSALLHEPKLLILDEPFNFLDPSSQLNIKNMLKKYNQETGATIIISSHNLSHTIDVCSRALLLESGHLVCDIRSDEDDFENRLVDYFSLRE